MDNNEKHIDFKSFLDLRIKKTNKQKNTFLVKKKKGLKYSENEPHDAPLTYQNGALDIQMYTHQTAHWVTLSKLDFTKLS